MLPSTDQGISLVYPSSASLLPSAHATLPPAGGITAGVTAPWQMAPHLCQLRKKWLTWAIWRPTTATSTNRYHDIMISFLSYLFSSKIFFFNFPFPFRMCILMDRARAIKALRFTWRYGKAQMILDIGYLVIYVILIQHEFNASGNWSQLCRLLHTFARRTMYLLVDCSINKEFNSTDSILFYY